MSYLGLGGGVGGPADRDSDEEFSFSGAMMTFLLSIFFHDVNFSH